MPNAGGPVSRYPSFPPPSTTRLRHNTGRGKFPKPRENAPTVAYAVAPSLAESKQDRCLSSAARGAVRAARARGLGRAQAGWEGSGLQRRWGGWARVGERRAEDAGRGRDVLHTHTPRDSLWKKKRGWEF